MKAADLTMQQVKEALKQLEAGGADGSKETSGTLLQKKIYKNVQGLFARAVRPIPSS